MPTSNKKSPDIGFEILRPCEDHARLVMQWRNDPVTLSHSFDGRPKEWKLFWPEFLRDYFPVGVLPSLIARCDDERVAFVRFRPYSSPEGSHRRVCELSINVAPSARGKGIGCAVLKAVGPIAAQQGYDDLLALVKRDNTASHKVFRNAGYTEIGTLDKQGPVTLYAQRLTPAVPTGKGVFVIAEAGSNWRMGTPARDYAMACGLIDVAVEAGADAVKFQVYRAKSVYVENAGTSDYLGKSGIKEEITKIFQDLEMPYEMVPKLADYCKRSGIEFMATPFSEEDFDAIDPYVKRHKIASYEISHLRLIQRVAHCKKPVVMSTGASIEEDIAWAVDTFRKEKGGELTLLQCTAKYPASAEHMNLRVIPWLQRRFGVQAGLSDHSRDPVRAPAAAVALGARVIEKHYTLDNRLPGPDHSFAITALELKEMVRAIRETESMLGSGYKEISADEVELRAFARRGVQALRDIPVGEVFREGENIEILRPGKQPMGVHPRYLESLEGKRAGRALRRGEGVQLGDWDAGAAD